MHVPLLSRFSRVLTVISLALCAMVGAAGFSHVKVDSSLIVLAQASETTVPTESPTVDHGHDTPAVTPAIPDPKPRLNKKRVAFWGVAFMAATSVAFVIFGVWAMRKAPKPGQQRPG